MMNLSKVWKMLASKDQEIVSLYSKYRNLKKDRMSARVPGRRSIFNTVTELEFPCTIGSLGALGYQIQLDSLQSATRPIIMSTDGLYSIGRISYEAYLEQEFDDGTRRRDTMSRDLTGLYHFDIAMPVLGDGVDITQASPSFDFDWMLSTGSNERSYSQDCLKGQPFISRNSLMGGNYKQFEFNGSYFLDGNEMLSYTIRPILGPRPNMVLQSGIQVGAAQPTSAKFILQMVTIGHKILGNGHVNPGVIGHF